MQTRNIQIPQNLLNELGVPQIIDSTDTLPKNKVKDWDALNPRRQLTALTDIGWHHTGTFLEDGATATVHANNHIRLTKNETTGDGGMPYTFYIKDGQIEQCNDLLTFVYAISGKNPFVVSIAVEGCYSPLRDKVTKEIVRQADELSDANLRAMIALELTLRPLLPSYARTIGHNYYASTDCPGFSMTRFIQSVTEIQQRLEWKDSKAARAELAFRMANVILWTRNTAQGLDQYGKPTVTEEGKTWAIERLMLLESAMREHGFL